MFDTENILYFSCISKPLLAITPYGKILDIMMLSSADIVALLSWDLTLSMVDCSALLVINWVCLFARDLFFTMIIMSVSMKIKSLCICLPKLEFFWINLALARPKHRQTNNFAIIFLLVAREFKQTVLWWLKCHPENVPLYNLISLGSRPLLLLNITLGLSSSYFVQMSK